MTGILCMLIYYRFCHPTGPISMCCSDKLDKDTTDASIRQVHVTLSTVYDCKKVLLFSDGQLCK